MGRLTVAQQYCVVMRTGIEAGDALVTYGPFDDASTADWLAAFLTAEVDPATAYPLRSSTWELLAWRRSREESTL